MPTKPSLLVFSDDWGRHPSSCQHLIRRMLPSYQVMWVNTIGMRRPTFDRVTMTRGVEKLRDWFVPRRKKTVSETEEQTVGGPLVLAPKMWPWFARKHDRWLNARLLEKQLTSRIQEYSSGTTIGITTVPIVADLIGRLPVDRWVYYCVDDFSKWPGMDQKAIDVMESRLVREADVVSGVSEKLRERLLALGKESQLLSHGVDLDHWADPPKLSDPSPLSSLEKPLILFWGSIDWQMDLEFLRQLSRKLDRGTIVLLGPVTDPSPELFKIPRVTHVPKVAYEDLPQYAAEAQVLIMPYIDAPGLRESQPLKLKEYLASGKPAVVRDLPANRFWSDAFDLAESAERFVDLVLLRLETGLPPEQARARRRLSNESWESKASQFEDAILSSCNGSDGGTNERE